MPRPRTVLDRSDVGIAPPFDPAKQAGLVVAPLQRRRHFTAARGGGGGDGGHELGPRVGDEHVDLGYHLLHGAVELDHLAIGAVELPGGGDDGVSLDGAVLRDGGLWKRLEVGF